MILKIFSGEIDNILNHVHDIKENVIYMYSFEVTAKNELEILSESEED